MHEDHVAFSDEGMMLVLDMKPCEKERKEDERTEMRKAKRKKERKKERPNGRTEKEERKVEKKEKRKKESESKVAAGGFLAVCLIIEMLLKTELWKLKTPKMCFQFP